ncbi:putative 1-phosphatidylinositol 3-phosphate 5-kinase isoform X3 [Manduca sexta]|uniref:putative 1-phosphatidylinositol 3-phosphate 5-kinase isoform X3 n=1 Tax=Manduca sexta TaxID=7130 RepID=UPI00188F353B|nr:putative 1-phosphatidylinositol 3-phosphate 5-kinase isoform X3 [Manduca sexta]
MEKYDSSQLTEFPRFEPESSQSGVSTFFNKLWKFPIFSPSETSEDLQNKAGEEGKENSEDQKTENDDVKTDSGSYAVELEGRSLPNVVRRISSLVALGTGVSLHKLYEYFGLWSGTKYADTELARYWMPDDISRECYECASRFSALRRRHHCRVCGQIFCSRCCSQRVPGHIFGCAGGLRVCNYCCNVVLSYLKENDLTGEISPDLRTLQENLQVKFPEHRGRASGRAREHFMFAREQDERADARHDPKEALHDVFRQLCFTLPTQQHRYRLVRYNGVWRGCDILQWVMDNTNNKTRIQASMVCQNLLSSGYMECMSELLQFADYALYRPTVLPPLVAEDNESPIDDSTRLVESVSSYCLDLNLGDSSARLIKTPKAEAKSSSSSEEEPPAMENHEAHSSSPDVCKAIAESGEEHLKLLMRQCLARHSLAAAWLDVLYPLCQQAAEIISPDVHSNDMDVRNYVQVKKVPGGTMRDSCVIQGVVMTKNVAHRGMPQQISNPTILLLDCSVAYQRVEGKLTSLEPVLLQEREYLVRCAARMTALRARVVLCRGRVQRAVQDALRGAGVALCAAVRAPALRRAARCTTADPLASVDARIGAPRLGTAHNFYVKNFSGKTLVVLEGCAEPQLGCCILLRGAPLQELVRVKKVVKFMLLACYNWKLEKAFLSDLEAILPEPGVTFDDDEVTEQKATDENEKDEKNTNIDQTKSNGSDRNVDNISMKNYNAKLEEAKSNSQPVQYENEPLNFNQSPNSDPNDDTIFCGFNKDTPKSDEAENKTDNKDAAKLEDDFVKSKPYVRKADSDKNLSCGVPIKDFSDPLHSTLSVDDEVFLPKEEAELKADTQTERWSTDDVVLSLSPNVAVPAPYLETEAGRRCALRAYYPRPLVAPRAPPPTPRALRRAPHPPPRRPPASAEVHPFIRNPITTNADDPALKTALAHYRATGCRLVNDEHTPSCPLYNPSVLKKVPKELEEESNDKQSENEPLDPLDPENHQRLSLLLYSFSNKSANVPDFCVNPWIVTMDLYGRHDISLGAFLDKYCFNGDYKCTSNNCQVPMNQHVRRFVYGDVCLTITCNTVGHSNLDKPRDDQSNQVSVWTRCESCGAAARARGLSARARLVSLAQYVRTRVSGARYRRAGCDHPLHAHAHAFVKAHTTAWFRTSKIQTYEIELPPDVISTKYDVKQMRDTLINQLNELMLKGHETFSGVTEGEAEKEYAAFKQHTEQIHLALTSASLQEHTTLPAVVRSLWTVSDNIIAGEKMLRDAQDKWSCPPPKIKSQPETTVDDKSDIEDSSGENGNEGVGVEEDEERGDKKTVRQILSQLLSNNQPSHQAGMIISSGLVPVVVQGGEIGSVIAATLASLAYRRALALARHSTQIEQEDGENSNNTGKEKSENDKSKSKSNDHVEVLLKDGLVCRVYAATQFAALRHAILGGIGRDSRETRDTRDSHAHDTLESHDMHDLPRCRCDQKTLCDIEEAFIRSLAHCVPWAAKGGKSGSTFCKTKDDRYVLKEMTKPEWQQFLDFAPHYFNYVNNCRQNNLPSLLARIVGVYSVGGAGNGVLVMENIWYGRPRATRFDLKGSSRHRLAADTQPRAVLMDENLLNCKHYTDYLLYCNGVLVMENIWYGRPRATRFDLKGSSRHRLAADTQPRAVLMDENLLNLRWSQQLYVASHTGGVLWACVERDTAFLAALGVMDYSLLLGIDGTTLVLGIIDYIRTFTWDKKLEHLVKKNLGSGQPTVVSPEQYKRRFCAACRKYFLHAAAHWDLLIPPLMHPQ